MLHLTKEQQAARTDAVEVQTVGALVEAAVGRSVDDDDVEAGVILGHDTVECLFKPGPRIMSHHHGGDRWRCGARLARHVRAHVGDWDVDHGLRRLPLDSPVDVALPTCAENTSRSAPEMVAHPLPRT